MTMMDVKKVKITTIFKYLLLSIIIIVIGIVSYYFIMMGLNSFSSKSVSYTGKSNVDYKVYLFKNNFFEQPYLEKDKTYISSLIDYIDIDFNYNLSFDNMVYGSYTYYVNGTIAAKKPQSETGSSYWSKTYTLKGPETINYDKDKGFSFNTNVKVDYQKYNELLKDFKKEYGLSFDGIFKVELVIKSVNETDILSDDIVVESFSQLNIPLTQQAIDLSIDLSNNDDNKTVVEKVRIRDFTHTMFTIIGILLLIVDVFLIYILFRAVRLIYIRQSQYYKKLKKILTTYDSIIVNVSNYPDLSDLNVIEVNSFSELVDAHSEVRMPINYYEFVHNYKSEFILIGQGIAWVYTLINHEYETFVGAKRKIKNSRKDN